MGSADVILAAMAEYLAGVELEIFLIQSSLQGRILTCRPISDKKLP